MQKRKTSVLVVDDSLFMREYIAAQLGIDDGLTVVGKASSAYEAQEKILELNPDVITLDIQMPGMDGIEFLHRLMPKHPLPVVVVSAVSGRVFDAMNAGAVDFVTKSAMKNDQERQRFISELAVKIKIASIARVGQHKQTPAKPAGPGHPVSAAARNRLIALGASTGGTEATYAILRELGSDLPGMLIVQHMPPVFTRLYAERLNNTCAMQVKEAETGDVIQPGCAYVAPGGLHMTVAQHGGQMAIVCREGEKVNGHCPSVDEMFLSVTKLKNVQSLGILLTGMGSDGAKGLLNMRQGGARTIGQNQQTSVVYGMPAVAAKIGAVDIELPLQEIAKQIYLWNNRMW